MITLAYKDPAELSIGDMFFVDVNKTNLFKVVGPRFKSNQFMTTKVRIPVVSVSIFEGALSGEFTFTTLENSLRILSLEDSKSVPVYLVTQTL